MRYCLLVMTSLSPSSKIRHLWFHFFFFQNITWKDWKLASNDIQCEKVLILQCCIRKLEKTKNSVKKRRNLAWLPCESAVAMAMSNDLKRQLTRPNLGERYMNGYWMFQCHRVNPLLKILKKQLWGREGTSCPCTSEGWQK